MKSRAAIALQAGKPLIIDEVDLEGPKQGEVLIRIVATGVCHTDAFTLSGEDPEGLFPVILGHEGAGIVEEVGVNVTSLKVGDHVIVEAAEEMAVYMREKNAPNTDGTASIAAKAAPGEKPGALFAETTEMTATVTAIDLNKHTATLKFADGSSKTGAVRPDVTLNKNQIGRQVVFRLTSAMAITVESM